MPMTSGEPPAPAISFWYAALSESFFSGGAIRAAQSSFGLPVETMTMSPRQPTVGPPSFWPTSCPLSTWMSVRSRPGTSGCFSFWRSSSALYCWTKSAAISSLGVLITRDAT